MGFGWRAIPPSIGELFAEPRYVTTAINTLLFVGFGVNVMMFSAVLLSGFFMRRQWWVRPLLAIYLLCWALPAVPAFISFHWMLIGEQGLVDALLRELFGLEGPIWFNDPWLALGSNIIAHIWKWLPFWTLVFIAGRLAIPQEIYEAAAIDGAVGVRRFLHVVFPLLANIYVVCTLLATLWTVGDYTTVFLVSMGAPARSSDVLATLGMHYAFDAAQPELGVAAVMSALPVLVPLALILMRRLHAGRAATVSLAKPLYGLTAASWRLSSWRPHRRRRLLADVAAWALGLLLLVWSLLPTYNMLLIALDEEGDTEYAGIVWPAEPTLDAFRVVLTGDYWYLQHFWLKFANSLFIALATMLITLAIGSLAAFALGRMKLARGWLFGNFPVLTYAVPASFLVIPFYRIMRVYGLSDSLWAVIAADVTFATPYAILILQQYAKLIPKELDEAAQIDGATPWQIYRHLYLPLTAPALAAVGTFALLFAWNEYIYQYILLTSERKMTVAVAIAQFFDADEAPWNYMMATAILYALPPVAIFFALRRWMLAGLTLGGVRS